MPRTQSGHTHNPQPNLIHTRCHHSTPTPLPPSIGMRGFGLWLVFGAAVAVVPSPTLAPPPPTNNTYCSACEKTAQAMMEYGCAWAKEGCTELPPPANSLCAWAVGAGLCPYISNFTSPYAACKELGLCGTACECGVCTNRTAGPSGRCLGAPNSCGHPHTGAELIAVSEQHSSHTDFCVDGQCGGKDSLGCCLTCV